MKKGIEARPVSRLLGGLLILRQGRLEGIAVDRNRLLGIGELGALRSSGASTPENPRTSPYSTVTPT